MEISSYRTSPGCQPLKRFSKGKLSATNQMLTVIFDRWLLVYIIALPNTRNRPFLSSKGREGIHLTCSKSTQQIPRSRPFLARARTRFHHCHQPTKCWVRWKVIASCCHPNVETQGTFYLKLCNTLKRSHCRKSPSVIIRDKIKITEQDFYWMNKI